MAWRRGFFAKPFGVLPPAPGVGEGESSKQASQAPKDDQLYLEWRRRVARRYAIDVESEGFRLRLCDHNLVSYAKRPFSLCLEGYPEIRGTTDNDGFVIVDAPPRGRPRLRRSVAGRTFPEETVRWTVSVGTVISATTPMGAERRLFNLDYYAGEPTQEMTDELREAILYFQSDNEGLKATGELDGDTCGQLGGLHECESVMAEGEDDGAGPGEAPPAPRNARNEPAPVHPAGRLGGGRVAGGAGGGAATPLLDQGAQPAHHGPGVRAGEDDTAMSLAAALDDPKRIAELAGVAVVEPQATSSCELTWTDREKMSYAQRPTRAVPETAWRAVTVPGKAVLGRYSAGLWAGDCRTPSGCESPMAGPRSRGCAWSSGRSWLWPRRR